MSNSVAEIFSESQYAQVYPLGMERNFWNLSRNALVMNLLRPLIGERDLVVDVGCGAGFFVAYARGCGLNIRGVERGNPVIEPGLKTVIDTNTNVFELAATVKAQIRVVLLLDVIEHIDQRKQFLRRLYQELPHCEYLLLTVPARAEMWSNYDEYWGHYLRFDRPQLAAELFNGGYRVIESSYCFHWVYLAAMFLKLLRIKRKVDAAAPARNPLVLSAHWLLGWLTRLESKIIPGFVAGSSIICVAVRTSGK